MKRNFIKACIVLTVLMCETGFAASGLLFNVSASSLKLTISTTVAGHTYPAAGIKLNTSGYVLDNTNPGCTMSPNGYCLFPVSDTAPASINISGPSGTVHFILCLNGKGPLSCQNYSLKVVANGCGRFTTGFTGPWSTVAANPLDTGVGFSDYLPVGAPATLYLGRNNNFDSFSSSSNSYTTLSSPPTSFGSYRSMAYFGGFIWSMTNGDVIKYDPTTNTWTTPATGLLTADSAQTAVDDQGNLWTWQDASNLLEYNIATGTTTIHPLSPSLSSDEPRIVYDSCSRLFYLADFDSRSFHSYDPSTGTVTPLASLPGSQFFQDGFCADRSGHVFAVVNGSNGMYQYTISTDTWVQLPTTGSVVGASNSACGIGSDGFLYASDPGEDATMYRIQLQ